ncbi:protein SET DOMAIN GROUP 40 isoform X1 [Gossypium hirsutum]|uniref:Protein SET DOMAIN GROUP 40 isoform X1 n=5 Tax=Gossypium TaxID=3633 RepID=A0ABM2YPK8_GOSHI|nr:protein SET DOMAIN GROUP 40-like isoform X1 [Gossypium hirsutum]
MKLCLLHSKPIFLTLLPRQVFTVCLLYEINKGKASPWHPYFLHLPHSYSILAAFGELETQALKVDYAIWAAQKAVTKAKYEWEQAFTLMKELKLKPPLLTFRAWILATGTALDLKPNYVRAWANMGISYANQVSYLLHCSLIVLTFMKRELHFLLYVFIFFCILNLCLLIKQHK